jgi:hypothetical protein
VVFQCIAEPESFRLTNSSNVVGAGGYVNSRPYSSVIQHDQILTTTAFFFDSRKNLLYPLISVVGIAGFIVAVVYLTVKFGRIFLKHPELAACRTTGLFQQPLVTQSCDSFPMVAYQLRPTEQADTRSL